MIPEALRGPLEHYVERLRTWGKTHDLAGPAVLDDPWRDIAEALAVAEQVAAPKRYLDLGSGGGLPAIPLAIAWRPERVVLLEPRQKRWAFLELVAAELGLPVEVRRLRWQELARQLGAERFDLVSSRGLDADWLAAASAWLASGGRALLLSSEAKKPADPAGGQLEHEATIAATGRRLLVWKQFHVEQDRET